MNDLAPINIVALQNRCRTASFSISTQPPATAHTPARRLVWLGLFFGLGLGFLIGQCSVFF